MRENYIPWIQENRSFKVAIIGDIILDEYLEGDVHRISPEAPVPIHHVKSTQKTLGGAGNTARNIALAGGSASLFSVSGLDDGFKDLQYLLREDGIECDGILTCENRPTIRKTRVTSKHQQLLRIDWERVQDISEDQQTKILNQVQDQTWDAVLVSDYGKGALPESLVQKLIGWCNSKGIPCLVDPKGSDFSRYANADLITPNFNEACVALGLDSTKYHDAKKLGIELQKKYGLKDVLVTMGPKGMLLIKRPGQSKSKKDEDQETIYRKPMAREVFDVSGAGDAVVAMMALSLASKCPYPQALELANLAAGRVVEKWGTQPITLEELKEALDSTSSHSYPTIQSEKKIQSLDELVQTRNKLRQSGKKVVFTNGCFDIFHAGHLSYLQEARTLGDILIVGINGDESIKRLKGPKRPIIDLEQRQAVLAGLSCVDYVVSFNNDTPKNLIETLCPDCLVKGADWNIEEIVGGDFVIKNGGEVKTITLVPGISTSEIVERILTKS